MRRGIEIDAVDDAFQQRVRLGDFPHTGGDTLTDLVRQLADDRPDRLVRVVRLERKEKRTSLWSARRLESLLARPDFGCDAIEFVVKTSQSRLAKMSGRM